MSAGTASGCPISPRAQAASERTRKSSSARASMIKGTASLAWAPIAPSAPMAAEYTPSLVSSSASIRAGMASVACGPSCLSSQAAAARMPGFSSPRASTNADTPHRSARPSTKVSAHSPSKGASEGSLGQLESTTLVCSCVCRAMGTVLVLPDLISSTISPSTRAMV
jgi:hypothetical protein